MAILRPKGRRKSWVVVVYAGRENGKEVRRWQSFKSRAEAEEFEAQQKSHVRAGGSIPSSRLLVRDYFDQWLRDYPEIKNLAPSTRRNYSDMVRKHLTPALGGLQLRKLSPSAIQHFLSTELRGGKLSPTTVQYHYGLLHKVLAVAVRQGLLVKNPCDMVDRPARARYEMKVLDEEQTRLFLGAAKRYVQERHKSGRKNKSGDLKHNPALYPFLLAAVLTGMRQGELTGLRWKDVDLTLGRASITQTLYRLGGQKIFKQPKTTGSRRTVALPAMLVEELRTLREEQKRNRGLLVEKFEDNGLVFCQPNGRPLHGHNVTQRDFRRVLKNAHLPQVRFHDLRHTCATRLLQQGVNPKVVQEKLGHASPGFTLSVYSHVLPGMQEDTAARDAERLLGVLTESNVPSVGEASQASPGVSGVTGTH